MKRKIKLANFTVDEKTLHGIKAAGLLHGNALRNECIRADFAMLQEVLNRDGFVDVHAVDFLIFPLNGNAKELLTDKLIRVKNVEGICRVLAREYENMDWQAVRNVVYAKGRKLKE